MSSTTTDKYKLHFSGHESFACKQFWLKKGFDFAEQRHSFSDETAVVELGVGKNMVNSIRYWSKSFNIIDDNDIASEFGIKIFSENGFDPYLEDTGTIWLLHYNLIKKNKASIYSLLFNEFRKERVDFTKEQFHSFLKRKCNENDTDVKYNENTINSDINVLLKNFSRPDSKSRLEIEDVFSNMFLDLDLITNYKKRNIEEHLIDWYRIEGNTREELPVEILLFVILDNFKSETSISFRQLLVGYNSPGSVFALTAEGLYNKIQQIVNKYNNTIVYSETAGNQVLQFKGEINKWDILNEYYN
jgi:hypothetical protein